jgi:hydroxypyruvate isomerase
VGGPLALTGHIRIADVPGRNEPGTGEMNYPFVLDHRASDGPPGRGGLGAPRIPSAGWTNSAAGPAQTVILAK